MFQNNNRADNGGAISMEYISSEEELRGTINKCTFKENTADFKGGAVYINRASGLDGVVISQCRIENNTSISTANGDGGGGIYLDGPSNVVKIANTYITRNNSSLGSPPPGGGLYFKGPDSGTINPELMNCVVAGNKASSGGGIYASGRSQMAIANTVFYGNTATNTSVYGHAIHYDSTTILSPKPNVANSIIWQGSAPTGALVNGSNNALRIEESDIRETLSGVESSDNINDDPDFVDADGNDNVVGTTDDNYRLQSTSPCIDNADSASRRADYADLDQDCPAAGCTSEPTPLDLDLEFRVIGSNCVVDMGPYEYLHGGCPSANGFSPTPPDGTEDARRPHPKGSTGTAVTLGSREGIGSANEPITVTLTNNSAPVCGADASCWTLCETGIESVESPTQPPPDNDIASVTEIDDGEYEIVLDRPISGGHWTTIEYSGGGLASYASLPADSNRSEVVNGGDIINFLDCCYNSVCTGYDDYTCDIDRSGGTPYDDDDYDVFLDLYYGNGNFIQWYADALAGNDCEGEELMGGEGGIANAEVAAWFIEFLVEADPVDDHAQERFFRTVAALTQSCLDQFSSQDRGDLLATLSDPDLEFGSTAGADAAAGVIEALSK